VPSGARATASAPARWAAGGRRSGSVRVRSVGAGARLDERDLIAAADGEQAAVGAQGEGADRADGGRQRRQRDGRALAADGRALGALFNPEGE